MSNVNTTNTRTKRSKGTRYTQSAAQASLDAKINEHINELRKPVAFDLCKELFNTLDLSDRNDWRRLEMQNFTKLFEALQALIKNLEQTEVQTDAVLQESTSTSTSKLSASDVKIQMNRHEQINEKTENQ